jgi:hypothetical protein
MVWRGLGLLSLLELGRFLSTVVLAENYVVNLKHNDGPWP